MVPHTKLKWMRWLKVQRHLRLLRSFLLLPPLPQPAPAPAPAAAPAAPAPAGAENVTCPMPGTILAVNVQPGAAVKKGDVMFILEAMKMENEIMAPRDGKVVSVGVQQNASVNPGDLLAVIE